MRSEYETTALTEGSSDLPGGNRVETQSEGAADRGVGHRICWLLDFGLLALRWRTASVGCEAGACSIVMSFPGYTAKR